MTIQLGAPLPLSETLPSYPVGDKIAKVIRRSELPQYDGLSSVRILRRILARGVQDYLEWDAIYKINLDRKQYMATLRLKISREEAEYMASAMFFRSIAQMRVKAKCRELSTLMSKLNARRWAEKTKTAEGA